MYRRSTLFSLFSILALIAAVLAACAGQPAAPAPLPTTTSPLPTQPAPTGTPQSTPAPTTQPTEGGSAGLPATGLGPVTLGDNGRTITMQVDQTFVLMLGEGYTWQVLVDNQDILSRLPNFMMIRGAQGIYKAHRPGSATLTATGDPQCDNAGTPCATQPVKFTLYVVVH